MESGQKVDKTGGRKTREESGVEEREGQEGPASEDGTCISIRGRQ